MDFPGMHSPKGIERTTIYLAEGQDIYREAYKSAIFSYTDWTVVGLSEDASGEALTSAAAVLMPDIMVIGVKTLQPDVVANLKRVQEIRPEAAIVLLASTYDREGISNLREFVRSASAGCAFLLKHTIDTADQLTQIIQTVSQGRLVIDHLVMDELMDAGKAQPAPTKKLSAREFEVLSFMAKGYDEYTIAEVLGTTLKVVGRCRANIYKAFGVSTVNGRPRVHPVTMYLKATGVIPMEGATGVVGR